MFYRQLPFHPLKVTKFLVKILNLNYRKNIFDYRLKKRATPLLQQLPLKIEILLSSHF